MAYSLMDVLGYAPLTEALRLVAPGIPNPFPDNLSTVSQKIIGDRAKFVTLYGERHAAKFVKYGAPGYQRMPRPVGDASMRLLHVYEHVPFDLVQLQNLRSFESYTQDMGRDWLKYQIDEAGMRLKNSRIIALATMLRHGKVWIDGTGNVLPSSSGAVESLDVSIPATHLNQCNSSISASWALPSTDIPGDIIRLQNFALQETGMPLKTALYGKNIRQYLSVNDYVLSYLSRHESMRDHLLRSNTIPPGLFDIDEWVPIHTAFFEDETDTVQELWDGDLVTFLPKLDQPDKMRWWGVWEGSYPVPKTIQVTSGQDPMANHDLAYGQYAFALPTFFQTGVPTWTLYQGDVFAPLYRNPKAPMIADVVF